MEELINWFNTNQGFAGAILSGIAMIISIIFGSISVYKSRKAKKSEEKAAEYERNADEHNKAAKDYYDKMSERLDNERIIRRIESVYNDLWDNTKNALKKVMDGNMHCLSKNVISADNIGAVEFNWLFEYIESVDFLSETEQIKGYIYDIQKAVDNYTEAWQYCEEECRDTYEIILEDYLRKLANENDELKEFGIKINISISGWFVLYELLNNQNFHNERLNIYKKKEKKKQSMHSRAIENALNLQVYKDEIDKIRTMLSQNSSDIKNRFLDAIEKEYSLMDYYEKVKSTLNTLCDELERIIVNN